MSEGPFLVGVDIGSSAVKVCLLAERDSKLSLIRYAVEPLPPHTIMDGFIMNTTAVVQALQKVFSENRIEPKRVAINVHDSAIILRNLVLPAMSAQELAEQIPWEAQQHLPGDSKDYSISYEVLQSDENNGQMRVLLAAARKEQVEGVAEIALQAGLQPVVFDSGILSTIRAFLFSATEKASGRVLLADIGASNCSIGILSDSVPMFTRQIVMGGQAIVEALALELSMSLAEAEQIVIASTLSAVSNPKHVSSILIKAAEPIVSEIKRSVDFFYSVESFPPGLSVKLCGGASQSPEVCKAFEQCFGTNVERLNPWKNISIDRTLVDNALWQRTQAASVTALGLATRRSREITGKINFRAALSEASTQLKEAPGWLWQVLESVPSPMTDTHRQKVANVFGAGQDSLRKVTDLVQTTIKTVPEWIQRRRQAFFNTGTASKNNVAIPVWHPSWRLFLTYSESGCSLLTCLKALGQSSGAAQEKEIWGNVAMLINSGASLFSALQRQINAFDRITLHAIQHAEINANIEHCLRELIWLGDVLRKIRQYRLELAPFAEVLDKAIPWLSAQSFCAALSVLLKAQVPLLDALEACTTYLDSDWSEALLLARTHVAKGEYLGDALARTTATTGCPIAITTLILEGEKAGQLTRVLTSATLFSETMVNDLVFEAKSHK